MSATSFDALYHPSYIPTESWAKVQFLLWDRLYRIVPDDMQDKFGDEYINRVFEVDPNTMPMLSPEPSDLDYYAKHKISLERAFCRIGGKVKGNLKEPEFFGIHPAKAPEWLFKILEDMNLAREMKHKHESWVDKHHWVQEDAGYLIMSCLGSRMASRRGLEPITDRKMSFYLTAANEISEDPSDREDSSIEGALAMVVFKFYVPRNIDSLSFKQIFKLREEYGELRKSFHRTVRRLSKDYNLEGIVQKKRAQEALQECLKEFNEEDRKFRKSKVKRVFGGGKMQSIGVALGGIGATIAGGPVAGLAFTIGGTAIAMTNTVLTERQPSDFERSFHYLHILDKKLKAMGCAKEIKLYLPSTASPNTV